ncbi:MAG: hypothetical protein LR011_13875 [Verrucomicrobia bacterium]|nr:hypothetical protein [Verrucomicrobiota bacterium]
MEVMTAMGDRHVNIQILEKGDAGDLWALRKESLFTDPHSFSASVDGFKVWGIEPESIKVDGVNHDGIHMIYRL